VYIITRGNTDLVILKISVYITVQHETVIIPIRKNVNLPNRFFKNIFYELSPYMCKQDSKIDHELNLHICHSDALCHQSQEYHYHRNKR